MPEKTKKRRPFHESVVDAINRASSRDLLCLAELIKETAIPKGHDEILAAWDHRIRQVVGQDEFSYVRRGLLEQKREAEEKEKAKQEQKENTSATTTSPAAS